MRKLSSTKGGKNKNRTKEKTNNQYLKEILKNIQNIQYTILKKLDKTTKHDEEHTIPLTPKRQKAKPLQNNVNRNGRYDNFNSQQPTPKRASKKPGKSQKYPVNSFLIFNEDTEKTKYSSNYYSGKEFSSCKPNKDKLKTENLIEYFTVRCKEKNNSKNDQYRSITERIGNQQHPNPQRKTQNAKQIQRIQKFNLQTQKSIQTGNSNIKNEIQTFYKNEINKLQIEQKIKQLQTQLQSCLSNKKVANLSQFHFIRSRMKRISVQINELKQKRYNMKRQMLK